MTDPLPAAPLSPPPRTVAPREPLRLLAKRFGWGLLLLLVLAIIGFWCIVVCWWLFGTDTVGRVTGQRISRGKSTSYYVAYTYNAPDGPQRDEETVGGSDYRALQAAPFNPPPQVKVRYLMVAGFHYSALSQFNGIINKSGMPAIFLVLFGVWFAVATNAAWLAPRRDRKLLENGLAFSGVILDKRFEKRRKSTRYFIKCGFHDAAGKQQEFETETNSRTWETLEIAQLVTVLMDPASPNRRMVYEASAYRVSQYL